MRKSDPINVILLAVFIVVMLAVTSFVIFSAWIAVTGFRDLYLGGHYGVMLRITAFLSVVLVWMIFIASNVPGKIWSFLRKRMISKKDAK